MMVRWRSAVVEWSLGLVVETWVRGDLGARSCELKREVRERDTSVELQ